MISPFTFGVEIEMAVAILLDSTPHPDSSERRQVRFITSANAAKDAVQIKRKGALDASDMLRRVMNAISTVLLSADIDLGVAPESWEVDIDFSVMHPAFPKEYEATPEEIEELSERYEWIPIEVESPAVDFCPESLEEVAKVCALITSNFKVVTNINGITCHLGHDIKDFEVDSLRKFITFLYAYELQIDSLHPLHRHDGRYSSSLRHRSFITRLYQQEFGKRPTTLNIVTKLLNMELRHELTEHCQVSNGWKDCKYNFHGVSEPAKELGDYDKRTIENSQYAGTVDGKEITQWVKTVVGMATFVETENFDFFVQLLASTTLREDRGDDAAYVLAHKDFNILRLL